MAPRLEAGDHWGVPEVAEHLGVERSTVYSYISRRQMPAPIDGFEVPIWRADVIIEWAANRPHPKRHKRPQGELE